MDFTYQPVERYRAIMALLLRIPDYQIKWNKTKNNIPGLKLSPKIVIIHH